VYRTLRLLDEKGLVSRVACQDACARFDAVTARHHHFACSRCGALIDVYSEELNALRVPAGLRAVGVVDSTHVELRGVCAACLAGRAQRKR
jgi:Fur family peroxide stress response transcriptional regulator